jgi:cellulase
MKFVFSLASAILGAQTVLGHAIFQRLRINDVDQGQLVGVQAPAVNNPVLTVTAPAIACNTGLNTPISTAVVTIPAGAKVGAWYEHILGGPQGAGDPDNPIAASHKGPLLVYLAKVDDAATADWTGLSWFKIAEEGLNTITGKWGVDSMIAGAGWWNFTMPECIAAGQYLLRVELIGKNYFSFPQN